MRPAIRLILKAGLPLLAAITASGTSAALAASAASSDHAAKPAAKAAPAAAPKTAARSAAPQSAGTQGPSAAEFAHWHRRYLEERGKAAKGEACIRSSTCVSDESDYLKHIEAAHKLRKAIEGWALAGNHHAAYYAGLMSFDQAKSFDEEFRIYSGHKDERYLAASHRFLEFSDRELKRAKDFLYPAAYAHRPESCMLMGEIMEYDRFDPKKSAALVFYYCASREYHLAGNRDLAMKAYSGMLRTGHPQDPMIVEMHARLLPEQPANPWRPIQPLSSAASEK